MSAVESGSIFDDAMQNGLSNYPAGGVEVYLKDPSNNLITANTNPISKDSNLWASSGSTVACSKSQWGQWQSNGDNQNLGEIEVWQDDGGGLGSRHFLTIDGGDFANTQDVDNGDTVTVTPGALDLVYNGLAYVIINGDSASSIAYDCKIYDGGGTLLDTVTAINYSYDVGLLRFTLGSNVTFTNNSASQWGVEQVRIETQTTGEQVYDDSSISVTVPQGSDLTFSQLQLDITI